MEYLIGIAIFGGFIGVIVYFAKKNNERLEQMIETLTDQQKNKLALTEIKFVAGKNNEWTQEGMIVEMIDKGNKIAIKVLWHNKVIQNNKYDQLSYGDITLSKAEVDEHNLKNGDFVKVYIAPEKTTGCFKIIFE